MKAGRFNRCASFRIGRLPLVLRKTFQNSSLLNSLIYFSWSIVTECPIPALNILSLCCFGPLIRKDTSNLFLSFSCPVARTLFSHSALKQRARHCLQTHERSVRPRGLHEDYQVDCALTILCSLRLSFDTRSNSRFDFPAVGQPCLVLQILSKPFRFLNRPLNTPTLVVDIVHIAR